MSKYKTLIKKYILYLVRWQLSSPVLAICLWWLVDAPVWLATVVANFIGGLIFFWVDKFIFTGSLLGQMWEVRDHVLCSDCGAIARGYRLAFASGYDRTKDEKPKFRCETCSISKARALKEQGVLVDVH